MQAQLGGTAQIPGLVGTACRGEDVALVAVEQRDGHGKPDDVHPVLRFSVVLAADAHRQVGYALGSLQAEGRLALVDLDRGEAKVGGFADPCEQRIGRRQSRKPAVGALHLTEGEAGLAHGRCELLISNGALHGSPLQFQAHLGKLHPRPGRLDRRRRPRPAPAFRHGKTALGQGLRLLRQGQALLGQQRAIEGLDHLRAQDIALALQLHIRRVLPPGRDIDAGAALATELDGLGKHHRGGAAVRPGVLGLPGKLRVGHQPRLPPAALGNGGLESRRREVRVVAEGRAQGLLEGDGAFVAGGRTPGKASQAKGESQQDGSGPAGHPEGHVRAQLNIPLQFSELAADAGTSNCNKPIFNKPLPLATWRQAARI
ncbi:hypothetical protein D3C81_890400 [compost metagenome]